MKRILLLTALTALAVPMMAETGIDPVVAPAIRPMGTPMLLPGELRPSLLGVRRASAEKPIFTPDWTGSITTQEEFDWFTVIDANGDSSEGRGLWTWRDDARCAWYDFYTAYGENVDDWLVTPGLRLKAGKRYTLKFYTNNHSTFYDDKMEVKLGTQPTVEGLTTELMPKFSVMSSNWEEKSVEFTVDADGVYYIGFHLMEAGYMSSVFLDEVSVTGENLAASPAAVEDLTVTPDPTGSAKAVISFRLPEKTVGGDNLASLSGVKIRNGYFDLGELTDVRPGQQVTYTAEMPAAGTYTFNVVAYNDVDEGANTAKTLYVGLDVPGTPQNVVLHDITDHMTVDCDPITAAHEGVFFPENVDFKVYEITRDEYGYPAVGDLIATVTGRNSVDINISTVTGEQSIVSYVTNAENAAGPSPNYYQTNNIVLGAPYPMPFEETFDNGRTDRFWMTQVKAGGFGTTGVYSSAVDSYDITPGSMLLSAVNKDDIAGFYTGKISMQQDTAPVFAFAAKRVATKEGKLRVLALTPEGEEIEIDSRDVNTLPAEWTPMSYDLSAYTSHRYLSVGLQYTANARGTDNQIYFDHIFVGTLPAADLRASVSAQKTAERGTTVPVKVRVDNRGGSVVTAFDITLTANGEQVESRHVTTEMPVFGMTIAEFEVPVKTIETNDHIVFEATVTIDGDTNTTDNKSSVDVAINNPDLATPSDLNAEVSDSGVALSWTPVGELAPRTDNIDSYTPWNYQDQWGYVEHNVGEWTMTDVDEGSTGGFTDALYYGSQGQKFAYTVFNPYNYDGYGTSLFTAISEEVGASLIPHSGEQYFAGIYSADTYWDGDQYVGQIKDADNWVISPELCGKAQTIQFWVNNFKGLSGNGTVIDHAETYEVLYSTTGTEISDFIRIGESRKAAGGEWQKVTFDLPEGTKYFAIRHCSPYNVATGTPFIFMVDDIMYNVPNKPLRGYNIYRDGQLIDVAGPDAVSYMDPTGKGLNHLYQVTALYEDGTESGAIAITAGATGLVIIDGEAAPFDIYSTTGVLIRRGATDFNGLPSGVYITSDGRKIRR